MPKNDLMAANKKFSRDIMGMNSPRKKSQDQARRHFRTGSMVKINDTKVLQKKHTAPDVKKMSGLGPSTTATQPAMKSARDKNQPVTNKAICLKSVVATQPKKQPGSDQMLKPYTEKPEEMASPSNIISFDLEIEEKHTKEEQSLRIDPSERSKGVQSFDQIGVESIDETLSKELI